MGLGPSIKMTSLHHFNCPVTARLQDDADIDFAGVIVDGVSELCDEKIYTATRTAAMAEGMRVDGAIVAIDGWGNHHIDFVNVIEQLGLRGIPSVGLSYVGLQGRLVCTNDYVDTIVDFNKSESGYESCVVGQNNLTDYDAKKAVAILKKKLERHHPQYSVFAENNDGKTFVLHTLTRKHCRLKKVALGDETRLENGVLTVRKSLAQDFRSARMEKISLSIVSPGDKAFFVNSNLDFMPIAAKLEGALGEGETMLLDGVCAMLTGVEAESGFQPANIGSSEGILAEQVVFDQAGTPKSDDFIVHIDFLFKNGEGRSTEGLREAHEIADRILGEIRLVMKKECKNCDCETEVLQDVAQPGKKRIVLVKIVSGLGNMYDSALFPFEPAGIVGAHQMMLSRNNPVFITGSQVRDGAIHSLL